MLDPNIKCPIPCWIAEALRNNHEGRLNISMRHLTCVGTSILEITVLNPNGATSLCSDPESTLAACMSAS